MTAGQTRPPGGIGGFHAVIPAGGAGTRLWPLSRQGSPKFLHDLSGAGVSLLQGTVRRLRPLVGDRVVVVTGAAHAAAVCDQLAEPPGGQAPRVLAEPSPRDSMAAIAWAAATIALEDPDAIIGSFAADHAIGNPVAFRAAVTEAVEVARSGSLVTVGITPTRPATGFGWIRVGQRLGSFATACAVDRFVEKPDAPTATAYLDSGGYLWNAGMFVVRAGVLLDLLDRWHPELAAGVRDLAAGQRTGGEVWADLPAVSIDHAVAEPAAAEGLVSVVPGAFDWHDIGDVAALTEVASGDHQPDELAVLGDPDQVCAVDASGLVVPAGDRQVAILGVDDVVVIDTPDAVLVVARERAQDVKAIVDALRAAGREDLL